MQNGGMMFGIKYETWQNVCKMYFKKKNKYLTNYLQSYPFSKVYLKEKNLIISKNFYEKYTKSGNFIFYKSIMNVSDNFMQRSDGSFRDCSLVSPIMFLVLQSIGKEIHDKYTMVRQKDISVYYAGNYDENRAFYKNDYDEFYKQLNLESEAFEYFIKTDISNFFSNININILIEQIDKICNCDNVSISQTDLILYREFLKYIGHDKFPTIEVSVALSYLATIVYLDEIDKRLYQFINDIISLRNFKIIRYVDDCYILFSSEEPNDNVHGIYNEIINNYSSILKEYGMTINAKKCCIKKVANLNEELKNSFYDDSVNEETKNIEDFFEGSLENFFDDIYKDIENESITVSRYNDLINKYFRKDGIIFSPREVLNYYAYNNTSEFEKPEIRQKLLKLIEKDVSFIRVDPKILTIMILNTKDNLIKSFLNNLFKRYKTDKWNSYDTQVSINYLLKRGFRHEDLLDAIKEKEKSLYEYISVYCNSTSLLSLENKTIEKLGTVIMNDKKSHIIYFMYLCENSRKNYMVAYAYYKSFFDRFSANLDCYIKKSTKADYNKFYKEQALLKFYRDFDGSKKIIKNAQSLIHSNPLVHGSSELLDNDKSSEEILKTISELKKLIKIKLDCSNI